VGEEGRNMKIDWLIVFYNITLLVASIGIAFIAIQHAMFFYSFPPDRSRYVNDVPIYAIIVLGFLIYLLLKYTHFVEERGEMLPSEEDNKEEKQ
jgi:hypothetical protein